MTATELSAYGRTWFDALATPSDAAAAGASRPHSLAAGSLRLGDEDALLLALVPDPGARFPRARHGEAGLEEGWAFASAVRDAVDSDRGSATRRPIVVVVDVPSQAYGYVEELAGIHQSLAAAADALATARLEGHPVTALIVGKAISGAFLAIGLQANRILSLRHDGIAVQVMSKQSAARITRRTIEELDAAAEGIPAVAYDGDSFAQLGAVHRVIDTANAADPQPGDIASVVDALAEATADARADGTSLRSRLDSAAAAEQRGASILVRERVASAWNV